MAGCGVELAINRIFSFELDGLYFQKGSTFERTDPFFYSTRDVYVLSGLTVPLLIKLKLMSGPFPYFLGGLEISYFTAHTKTRSYWTETSPEGKEYLITENLTEETRRFDFGPVVGLGLEARVAKVFLFLEARFSLGLEDLSAMRHFLKPEIRTSSPVILTGFKFD